jgi:hypothetical protein
MVGFLRVGKLLLLPRVQPNLPRFPGTIAIQLADGTVGFKFTPKPQTKKKARYVLSSELFSNHRGLFGGLGRNRTTDTRIFSPKLLVLKTIYSCC